MITTYRTAEKYPNRAATKRSADTQAWKYRQCNRGRRNSDLMQNKTTQLFVKGPCSWQKQLASRKIKNKPEEKEKK